MATWEESGKVQGMTSTIRKLLGALGNEAEAHCRDSLALFQTRRTSNNLDATTCSLQYLTDSARSLQDAMKREFAVGIKIAKLDLEKSLEDYKVTLERIARAAKWEEDTVSAWEKKGRREADAALRKAKDKEAAKTRLRIMEAGRDKLIDLAESVQDETVERSRGELVDLENKVAYNKDNVTSMAHMLKRTTDRETVSRAEKAFKEAIEAAGNSCKHLDNLWTRLNFQNVDSEAESFLGGKQALQLRGQRHPGKRTGKRRAMRTSA
jgi:transcriptional regulator